MKGIKKLLAPCVLASSLAVTAVSCDSKLYEDCPAGRIIGDWGVVDNTHTFGEYDSLYYLINPIGNINDSVYYNGNYTDSYYHSDPVRVMLRYTPADSIFFNLDRQYATEINPINIIMMVREHPDSMKLECVLHLRRGEDNGNLYATGPDSLFKEMLKSGRLLKVTATNGLTSSEPEGSQNYEFTLDTRGFREALELADSLNAQRKKAAMASKDDKGKESPAKKLDSEIETLLKKK